METKLKQKYEILENWIRQYDSVAIAFSGGVDSAFLAKASHDVLGDKAVAVIVDSEAYPPENIHDARKLAGQIGIRLIEIPVRACDIPAFAENTPERCYHCKRALFNLMNDLVRELGIRVLIDGSNADDLQDYRPGMRALSELGVKSPLQELGFSKPEIRIISRELKLPTWNHQSFACLASRFPYGERITPPLLERTWKAEAVLREMGMRQYRVRNHGDIARIELDQRGIASVLKNHGIRDRIVARLKALGYRYVTLDMEGYRTGSMNEAIDTEEKQE